MTQDKRKPTAPSNPTALRPPSLEEATEALTRRLVMPTARRPIPPASTGRNTGAKIMETLDVLADRALIAAASSPDLDPRLVRSVKELATSWSQTHGEMRATIESMSDQEYLAMAQALGVDPPSPSPLDAPVSLSVDTNFSPPELQGSQTSHTSISYEPIIDFNEDD